MNIRWLSPLDSRKTEIGRYSQALLPYLHKAFALCLVADAIEVHEEFTPDNYVSGMEPINIYNLGNSYMHCGILRLAMEQPGVVILHDVSLLELGLAYAREIPEINLPEIVIREYGAHAGRAFDALYSGKSFAWCGESQEQYDEFVTSYPIFETFVQRAAGIVVHSDYALKRVKERYGGPVVKLDLPYEAAEIEVDQRRFEDPLTIVFCGHAGPNRRLYQFLEAWAKVSNPGYFRLHLYGNIDKADQLMSIAGKLGLSDFVNVIGFVDDEELDRALSGAHLALNLRNPTVGEASASQLRYWSNAIPTIVSDVGWYGELPDDVVMKVSPVREQEDLISVLEQLISGNQAFLECGINGHQYLRKYHNIGRYLEQLAEYLESISEARFVKSVFDDRLIGIIGSMCDDVNDSKLYEGTLDKLSGML